MQSGQEEQRRTGIAPKEYDAASPQPKKHLHSKATKAAKKSSKGTVKPPFQACVSHRCGFRDLAVNKFVFALCEIFVGAVPGNSQVIWRRRPVVAAFIRVHSRRFAVVLRLLCLFAAITLSSES